MKYIIQNRQRGYFHGADWERTERGFRIERGKPIEFTKDVDAAFRFESREHAETVAREVGGLVVAV